MNSIKESSDDILQAIANIKAHKRGMKEPPKERTMEDFLSAMPGDFGEFFKGKDKG